jgi:NAD(P)-dependent dehydrogenase (short-subunit alcohol dehydrogenase family)
VAGERGAPRVALITGGGSGIGQAVARTLAADGVRVVIADRDEQAGQAAAAEAGGVFVRTDVGDPDEVRAAVDVARRQDGRLDLVVLNAGITTGETPIDRLDLDRYRTIMAVNVDGVVFGVQAALPALRGGGGAIVVTASLSGLTPYPQDPVYSMTKHAVVGLTRSLADPLAEDGITINCVCPGFVSTALIDAYRDRFREQGLPLLTADEVAAGVLAAAGSGRTGEAWVCQPGVPCQPYRFRGVPGPVSPPDPGSGAAREHDPSSAGGPSGRG